VYWKDWIILECKRGKEWIGSEWKKLKGWQKYGLGVIILTIKIAQLHLISVIWRYIFD
jgi:hypothetical protein